MRDRLDDILESWLETPYMQGQSTRGRGVDCVRFVDCVLSEWFRVSYKPLPRLSTDSGIHSRAAFRVMRRCLHDRFPYRAHRFDRGVEHLRGDVLAVSSNEQPHHIAIVGSDGVRCYHASMRGVVRTSVAGLLAAFQPVRLYRLTRSPDHVLHAG